MTTVELKKIEFLRIVERVPHTEVQKLHAPQINLLYKTLHFEG